jgi:uncharacterized membrane protein
MRFYHNTAIILTLPLLLLVSLSYGHGGKGHKKDSVRQDSVIVENSPDHHQEHHHAADHSSQADTGLDEFPSFHPLIVHFAIVLIIIAALLQLINIVLLKKEFAWIITGLMVVGFIAAVLASTSFHPHTRGLSEQAKQVLALHDTYASWTLYLGGLATTLQILNLFFFTLKRWATITIALIMAAATYGVTQAGHYGARLVHIEGVGPQGKFLETDHHH